MIDFHNHILPNVDDGSKSLDISLEMLTHAANQGITDVVNTVHYQHPKVETEDISLNRIQRKVNELQKKLDQNDIRIKLHLGAEVFFLPNLISIKDDQLATFSHGKYMLIEFQVHQIPDIQKQQLFDLKMSGVVPIIAHPERYKAVQENINIVADWLEAGCLIQVDAGSPLGYLGSKSKIASEKIIKNGWCQLIGSDSHDNKNRNFCLLESVDLIRSWGISNVDEWVNDNPSSIIDGTPISVDFDYMEEAKPNFFSRIKVRIGLR
jgi:protein-tyrosine phosphatase